jgi:uncharacterized protein YegJ (DUF2314 family)
MKYFFRHIPRAARLIAFAVIAFMGCSRYKEGNNYKQVEPDDAAMNAAIEKAKSTVADFTLAFHAQKSGTKDFCVKKPYRTSTDSMEHMWIEVSEEREGVLKGRIANEAEETREVKMGQTVSLKISEISDWKYQDGNKLIGGFTIRYFVERMPAKEREAFFKEAGFEF